MKTITVKEVTLTDGVIAYTEIETKQVEQAKTIDSAKFIEDYNAKLEDYQFQVSEIARIQVIVDADVVTERILKQLQHTQAGHVAIRDKYLMEWNGIYQPINNELNIL